MDLEEIRALISVAESGSILAAADRLGLPRTTIRRRIDSIESRLGVPLLYRGVQGAQLTPAGELAVARGRRILDEANVLVSAVRDLGQAAEGRVRVAIPIGMPPHAMLPIYEHCRAAHPKLTFDVAFCESPLDKLSTGADLVVHLGAQVPSGPWVTRTLLRVPEVLLASPAYLKERGSPGSLADLGDHDISTWRNPGADPRQLPLLGGGFHPISPTLVANDIHTLRLLAIAGQGIHFLPDAGLTPAPGEGIGLTTVLPQVVGREVALRVVVPEPTARSPRIRALQESILIFLGE